MIVVPFIRDRFYSTLYSTPGRKAGRRHFWTLERLA